MHACGIREKNLTNANISLYDSNQYCDLISLISHTLEKNKLLWYKLYNDKHVTSCASFKKLMHDVVQK